MFETKIYPLDFCSFDSFHYLHALYMIFNRWEFLLISIAKLLFCHSVIKQSTSDTRWVSLGYFVSKLFVGAGIQIVKTCLKMVRDGKDSKLFVIHLPTWHQFSPEFHLVI